MYQSFCCVITKKGEVNWKVNPKTHQDLVDGTKEPQIKIMITPDKGYLYPEEGWTLRTDERTYYRWLTGRKIDLCWRAFSEWYKQVYSIINPEEIRNPINPLLISDNNVTEADIYLLKEWAKQWGTTRPSIWNSVCKDVEGYVGISIRASIIQSLGESLGFAIDPYTCSIYFKEGSAIESIKSTIGYAGWDAIRGSVWNAIGAYLDSLFTTYPGRPNMFPECVDLWKRGFVPTFDGDVWRLHSGKKAKIVYEWEMER